MLFGLAGEDAAINLEITWIGPAAEITRINVRPKAIYGDSWWPYSDRVGVYQRIWGGAFGAIFPPAVDDTLNVQLMFVGAERQLGWGPVKSKNCWAV